MNRLLQWIVAGLFSLQASVAWATIVLQSPAPERHDRFYDLSDPPKAFIGDPYDWSGVGRQTRWATMISPSYFLSAAHFHPGGSLDFYKTNDPDDPAESYNIHWGTRIADSDLWLGKLSTPVSQDIAKYPILLRSDQSDYDDLEIYTFGLSVDKPSATATTVRLGRNNIDPGSIASRTLGEPPNDVTGETFLFDYDDPGGVGDDESYLQGGDSGGPSFAIHNGSPALVGIHWFIIEDPEVSGDTFVPAYVDALNAAMIGQYVTLAPERVLTWDGQGNGTWNSALHWSDGQGGGIPDSTTKAIVRVNSVTLSADGDALSLLIHENARLVLQPEGTLTVVTSAEVADGTLDIRGTVDADSLQLAGTLNIAATGSLNARDVLGLDGAEYVFELGGSVGGLLTATRTVDLSADTTLILLATGNLEVEGDATRTIITAGAIDGTFGVAPDASDHLGYGVFFQNINYAADAVDVDLLQATVGDTDGDRDVDFADFNDLANGYTGDLPPGTGNKDWLQGDFDGDGDVDFADFNALASNYSGSGFEAVAPGDFGGEGNDLLVLGGEPDLVLQYRSPAGTIHGQTASAAVPEPGSLALLGSVGLGWLLWTVRRRRRP